MCHANARKGQRGWANARVGLVREVLMRKHGPATTDGVRVAGNGGAIDVLTSHLSVAGAIFPLPEHSDYGWRGRNHVDIALALGELGTGGICAKAADVMKVDHAVCSHLGVV